MKSIPLSPLVARSLSEAALWCASQHLTATPEQSPDQVRRRGLFEESLRLMRIIYAEAPKKLGSWSLSSSPKWQEAMNLLKEADPDSLVQLDHQLRSAALEPSGSIGYPRSEKSRRR